MVNIPYKRAKREIGKSRWTLKKKIKLFIDSFVSFSFFPLRLITVLGFIIGFVALIYSGIIIAQKINGKIPVSGWSSMMLIVLLTSSFQMIAIGILGEYLWRVLEASRKRPLYIVEKVYE
jgi:dolichol-phosphate mannosyltransferase